MAAVIGDVISDSSRLHAMIASPSLQQTHHHHHTRAHDPSPPYHRSSSTPRVDPVPPRAAAPDTAVAAAATSSSSKIPSPPASSPAAATSSRPDEHAKSEYMASSDMVTASVAAAHHAPTPAPAAVATPLSGAPLQTQPSPSPVTASASTSQQTPLPRQTVVHVRDLAHVRSMAQEPPHHHPQEQEQIKYDISGMPIGDVIEMVAALLTKITSTNDLQHDAMQRNAAHQQQASQYNETTGAQMSPMSHSVLAFHGKNKPSITILSYLARIYKYCPTTFEVFLSLLVYFDRMTERVNDIVARSDEARREAAAAGTDGAIKTQPSRSSLAPSDSRSSSRRQDSDVGMRDSVPSSMTSDDSSDLADDDDDEDEDMASSTGDVAARRVITVPEDAPSVYGPSTYFVVDNFNIHRLIIAGVTCSSKFFSDVFYTNSRYAKVGSRLTLQPA